MLDSTGNLVARTSFAAFGARRGGNWNSSSSPDWAAIANTSRHGYTGHEHLDNLALIHMNGRVYDPGTGRFMSVDPIISDPADSQTLNPYAYVGNRPLSYTDPSGFDVVCGGVCTAIVISAVRSFGSYILGRSDKYVPPATALQGQSAQTGMSMCGPGQTTPNCGGSVLYAVTADRSVGEVPSSSWVNEVDSGDPYVGENLEQFFVDLGTNAVEVVILAPDYDAKSGYDAASEERVWVAAGYLGMTICDVVKDCEVVALALKPVARAARGLKAVGRSMNRGVTRGPVVIGETMTRVERAATKLPDVRFSMTCRITAPPE